MPKIPKTARHGEKAVAMAFYVPATYHALYGRFFQDPSDVSELEKEYSKYLWERATALRILRAERAVKSVRVEMQGFLAFLAELGIDFKVMVENNISGHIAMFAATLKSPHAPIIEVLQALPDPLPSDPLYGTIATLAPLPELRREEDVAEVVVGATLMFDAGGERVGRYLSWADGNFPATACMRAIEAQCARIPAMLSTRIPQPVPLHLCSCCKLPDIMCPNVT